MWEGSHPAGPHHCHQGSSEDKEYKTSRSANQLLRFGPQIFGRILVQNCATGSRQSVLPNPVKAGLKADSGSVVSSRVPRMVHRDSAGLDTWITRNPPSLSA